MRSYLILIAALLISLAVHALLFDWSNANRLPIGAKSSSYTNSVVTLTFSQLKEVEPVATKHRQEPKIESLKSKEIAKVKPAKETKREENRKEVSTKQSEPPHKPLAKREIKSISTDEIEARKDRFFQEIKEKIKKYKSYPYVAKRRRIQGDVALKFYILSDGNLGNINILSGKKIFHKATKEAIENSFPHIPPKESFEFPIEVSLTLQFRLR